MVGKVEKLHREILDYYGLLEHESICEIRHFDTGEEIYSQGVEYKHLMIVVSGKAKICVSAPNGKDLILAHYLSRGLIGHAELMTGMKYATASVMTLSPFECILIPFQSKQDNLFKNLTFMTRMTEDLALNMIRDSYNFTSNVLFSGEQRLCSYIAQGAYKDFFFDRLTDVAATVGISYRHLMRLLKKLAEDNILKKENGGFQIIDMTQLKARSAEGVQAR